MSSTSASPISNITVDDELQIREGKQKIQTRKKLATANCQKNEEYKQKRKCLALLIVL